jgi:hypothetical protein
MRKRSSIILGVVCALALSALLAPAPARAQDKTHYTFVSFWAVPRAQWNDFERANAQSIAILEKLVADGTLVAWGYDVTLVHTEDGFSHSNWFVSETQGGILKTLQALQSVSRTPQLSAATKHRDYMLHSVGHGGKTAQTTSGYIRVAFWHAKPGRGDDMEQFFKKYIQPDLDAGVADGSVLMYNFDTEVIHTDEPGGYNLAVVYANGDGLDKNAAILAKHAKDDPAVGEGFASMLELKTHRDDLSRILAFQHK